HYCVAGTVHLWDRNQQGLMTGEENVFVKNGTQISRMAGVGSFAGRHGVPGTGGIKSSGGGPLARGWRVGCGGMAAGGPRVSPARVQPGQTVAVFGCGGVGLNVIQGSALCGASRIIAVDLSKSKLELAKQFGATDVVDASSGDAADRVRELTGGLGVDYAFEVIGVPAVIVQAFLALKRGGKAIVVGVPPFGSEVPIPGFPIPLDEKSVIGSLYGSANMRRDMPKLIDLYMRGRLKIDELV